MATSRDIKRRIKSVKNMQQITKAMKMTSAVKLRKASAAVIQVRPYLNKIEEVTAHLSKSGVKHPYLKEREVKKTAYLIFVADRGLCGSSNNNVLRLAENHINQNPNPVGIITIGLKARDYFVRRKFTLDDQYNYIGDVPTYTQIKGLVSKVSRSFDEGIYDEVYVVYNRFRSTISHLPTIKKILPIQPNLLADKQEDKHKYVDYIFEPDAQIILSALIPQYVEVAIYNALIEAKASEHGARMTAMSAATDNALDMINALTLSLNRARQAAITKEISEIVGGAAALS